MLPPDRVMTLIEPPEAPPDSAERPVIDDLKLLDDLRRELIRLEPLNSSLLSRPSMERLLLRGRRPPKVKPLPARGLPPGTEEFAGELETAGSQKDEIEIVAAAHRELLDAFLIYRGDHGGL